MGHTESSQPLQITPGLDPSWIQRQIHNGLACPIADAATATDHHNQGLNFHAPDSNTEHLRLSGHIQQPEFQHPSFTMDTLGMDGNLLAPDVSFFDLFTEYYPTLSGFDNPSVFGDLFR
jgi:hypothetical protein